MAKPKRIVISNNSINSYGTRVLTEGMDISQYQRNPVLLYMHWRGMVIGNLLDIKKEGENITAELSFDEASEMSKQFKKQYEFGSLKMVSVGIDVIEMSEDPDNLIDGQTAPTITKSKLYEVSLVDIGANDDAIVLRREGKIMNLSSGSAYELPKLSKIDKKKNQNQNKEKEMDQQKIALQLGLAATATEADIAAKIAENTASLGEIATLRKEKEELTLATITQVVDGAIAGKQIEATHKDQFIALGKKVGIEDLKATFAAMSPRVKISDMTNRGGGTTPQGTYTKLSEVPESEVMEIRTNDAATYTRLYNAEYGFNPKIEK